MSFTRRAAVLALGFLSSCAAGSHAPPYATRPYQAFSRSAAVDIALREWRLWGSGLNDNPHYVQRAATMPERAQGLWQRVGDYWWVGLNASSLDSGWTGKHDAQGKIFPVAVNGDYAWSAAFISYIMRVSGAGSAFPYAADHAYYINEAARPYHPGKVLIAENPEDYAPRLGDLVCFSRSRRWPVTFQDLPTTHYFPSHCDIVVRRNSGVLSVIGGNVDDAVLMTKIPITSQDLLQDKEHQWLVVLRVLYAQN